MAHLPSILSAAIAALRALGPTIRPWSALAERTELSGASLAIVGNAGYLANLDQGPLIDSHDLVLRMNNFRTAGFERSVGQKFDIFLTSFHHDIDLENPALRQARFIVTSVPFNIAKRRRAGLQHRHAASIATGLRTIERREAFVPELAYYLGTRQRIGRYPSTGAMAVLLAADFLLPVCRRVFVTGFSFFAGQGHYFQPGAVIPRNHDPEREMTLVRSILAPYIHRGQVQLDRLLSRQLGFSAAAARAA